MREKPTIGEIEKVKGKLYTQFYKQYIKNNNEPYKLDVAYWQECSRFVESGMQNFLYYGKKP